MLRRAILADLPAIDGLRAKNWAALGFLPLSVYERGCPPTTRRDYLTVIEENADIVGFIYGTLGHHVGHIIQCCIREDARRFERGSNLVHSFEGYALQHGMTETSCRCRIDLESNLFWEVLGYLPIALKEPRFLSHPAQWHKMPLRLWAKALTPELFPLSRALFERLEIGDIQSSPPPVAEALARSALESLR